MKIGIYDVYLGKEMPNQKIYETHAKFHTIQKYTEKKAIYATVLKSKIYAIVLLYSKSTCQKSSHSDRPDRKVLYAPK